jgi:HlyD family secretion protein
MRRWIIIGAAAAAALVAGSWLLWGNSSDNADAATTAERRAPTVTVVRAVRREIAEEVHVSGTLVPREEVLVAPEIDGLAVTEILVEEGDRVEKGQVLAKLSRAAIDAEAAQADAAVAQARAQIAEMEANLVEMQQALDRTETLLKSKTVSKAAYDQRLAAFRIAQARLNAAKHNLTVAEAQKEQISVRQARTEIKAPEGGIISRRTLKLGAIASMTGEPAFRIIEGGAVELQADVVDATLARFETGQSAHVSTTGAEEPLHGTIRLISAEVDSTTRLGRVRVALPLDAKVTIGSFASGVVEIGRKTAVTVPISAITVTGGKSTVQVVVDNKIATREVEIGLRAPTRAEVKTGLAENELVVARAGSFLRDGDAVTPVEANDAEASR